MENLSIVIKENSEEKVYEFIKILQPLLADNKTQLIIVNNNIEKFNINYYNTVYEYRENYSEFREFSLAVCSSDNIMIIESGMVLDNNTVRQLKESLIDNDKCINLKFKRYETLNKKKFYYINQTIISNSHSNEELDLNFEIEDYRYINFNEEYLEDNIYTFIEDKRYKELYRWYENYIVEKEEKKQKFYIILERLKLKLNTNDVSLIEKEFLQGNLDFKYLNFLKIKELKRNDKNDLCENITQLLIDSQFGSNEVYFSYFIAQIFKEKKIVYEVFDILDLSSKKTFMKYLFENYEDFYVYIYSYITSLDIGIETSFVNNKRIFNYIDILKIYIENMSDKSAEPTKKEIIIQMFIEYINYSFYILNKKQRNNEDIKIDSEVKFLIKIDKAVGLIENNKAADAAAVLMESAEIYETMTMPTRYYAQKLIYENNLYFHKISICMMAKNEEKYLDRCLKSIKPLVDSGLAELFFVDTGSSDKTVEIAKRYVDKVYFNPWKNSFSEGRNYTISLAVGEYIFLLDADEEFEPGDCEKLINIIKSNGLDEFNTVTFRLKNLNINDKNKMFINSEMKKLAIFKNESSFYYSGSVHNQPNYKGKIKNLDISVVHYGYIMTKEMKEKKIKRSGALLKKELQKHPNDLYYRFQLAVEYNMHKDFRAALEQVEIYMKNVCNNLNSATNLLYLSTAVKVYCCNALFDKALETCNMGLAINKKYIDFIYYKGKILFDKKKYEEAANSFSNYLSVQDEFKNSELINDARYTFYSLYSIQEVLNLICLSYYECKNYHKCLEYINKIENDEVLKMYLDILVESYFQIGDMDGLLDFYINRVMKSYDLEMKNLFKEALEEGISKANDEAKGRCILTFSNSNILDEYICLFKLRSENKSKNNINEMLYYLNAINLDELSEFDAKSIFDRILSIIEIYPISMESNVKELQNLKRCTSFVLDRGINLRQCVKLEKNELFIILSKYIEICSILNDLNKQLLSYEEKIFIENFLKAFCEVNNKNLMDALKFIKAAVIAHKKMAKPMQLYLETIIPGYEADIYF